MDSDTESDGSGVGAFATLDLTGVDFDDAGVDANTTQDDAQHAMQLDAFDVAALELEVSHMTNKLTHGKQFSRLQELEKLIAGGRYTDALQSDSAKWFFDRSLMIDADDEQNASLPSTVVQRVKNRIHQLESIRECVEAEFVGVAAFNLFLQLNYTGPVPDDEVMKSVVEAKLNPHDCFRDILHKTQNDADGGGGKSDEVPASTPDADTAQQPKQKITQRHDIKYHNAVLSELAVEGYWPCPVAYMPYLLLVARSILTSLCITQPVASEENHKTATRWNEQLNLSAQQLFNRRSAVSNDEIEAVALPAVLKAAEQHLKAAHVWSVRACVAHERLLLLQESTLTLWEEVQHGYLKALQIFSKSKDSGANTNAGADANVDDLEARILLEWGLAQHHFDRDGKGKADFVAAQKSSGLEVEVTGAMGKRTKFQQDEKAQMIVRATSKSTPTPASVSATGTTDTSNGNSVETAAKDEKKEIANAEEEDKVRSQMIKLGEDSELLENVKYEDEKDNEVTHLSILDQAILLAFCLDVKNTNPADGLTGEQMGAYLARILLHADDWMIYSTGLLERAWLDFERVHTKERSILQLQALADQHTNRLTITQSTRASVEESSPAQDRLRNLHTIVYPPRWHMLRDIADKYASIGIVTSAAELYTEIEYWDEVVDCYKRAGRMNRAEEIVRERLEVSETPRMWTALGDLTQDPDHYEKAATLSKGRYAPAYLKLGEYYFGKGDLYKAQNNYRSSVVLRPLQPAAWFRLGTISMQLEDWDNALTAFTEVVQQHPEEAEGWANIAAVHMHNKKPAEAYPALAESIKQNRSNWRVWVSKLHTCLDLHKYDEAIQACNMILDFRKKKAGTSQESPEVEAKCVRAIVGGILASYRSAKGGEGSNSGAMQSARRSLMRLHDLLQTLSTSLKDPWVYETLAYFNEQIGDDDAVLENLMKEYRSLQTIRGWEKDDYEVIKVSRVVKQIVAFQRQTPKDIAKSKFLVRGVVNRIKAARVDLPTHPTEISELESLLAELDEQGRQHQIN